MYKLIKAEDVIRVPPAKFGEDLEKIAFEGLKSRYEGSIIPGVGLIVSILSVEVSEIGKILPRDPSIHHPVKFEALTFQPLMQEVVEGEVVVVEDIGLFIRLGPIDGFIHKSQVSDDFFSYDRKQAVMLGTKSKRLISKGDLVRARIVQVSIEPSQARGLRVALTMRQPGMGKLEWLKEEAKKK